MKIVINMLLFLSFALGFGQRLPNNPKVGMCYERCFSYDSRIDWIEVDCDSLIRHSKKSNFTIKGEKPEDIVANRIKFLKYQEKLAGLGYNLKVSGCIDEQTFDAHHKYLKDKKKAIKRDERNKKRRLKDSLRNIKS